MPTILRWRGYKFLFFSLNEGKPPHVHVVKGKGEAKFWLADCRLARAKGFADRELNQIRSKVEEHRDEFLRAWHEHFGA